MEAIKLEVLVVDFDKLGGEGVARTIEDARYPNRCIYPRVLNTQVADLGEWDDSHPLNQDMEAAAAEVKRLFPTAVDTIEHDPDTLRPCPFCGGEASLDMNTTSRRVYVECDGCSASLRHHPRESDGAMYRPFTSADEARAAWNRRAP